MGSTANATQQSEAFPISIKVELRMEAIAQSLGGGGGSRCSVSRRAPPPQIKNEENARNRHRGVGQAQSLGWGRGGLWCVDDLRTDDG